MTESINLICVHCRNDLTGKQQKYCSERCRKREANKRWRKKYFGQLNAKIKTRKIKNKVRRKLLIEQEIKKREETN